MRRGLADAMWLMQYQYSHGGYPFQGHRAQLASTSANWNALTRVAVGDWLAAYLRNGTFYAVGEVVAPRVRERHRGAPGHTDTVARTVQEHRHRFLDGVVQYDDAPVAYEDFTDPWTCPGDPATEHPVWQYPQRIDVREWQNVVLDGVHVDGLSTAVQFPAFRRAVFEIPEEFFQRVVAALLRKHA